MKYLLKLVIAISITNQVHGVKIQQSTPAGSSVTPFVSTFGELAVAPKNDSFYMMFQYNVPTDLITSTTSGSGTIVSTPPFAVLTSSTNGTGTAQIEGKKRLRYLPAHEGYAYFTAVFTTGVANTTQYIGLIDDNDGWAIGYNGTAFSVFWKRGGSNVSGYPLASTSFNLDKLDGTGLSKITIDPTKNNVYRISYGWLGSAPIVFEILRNDGIWFPFHMIKFPNTYTTTSTNSSILPLRAYASATGAASDVVLKTASMVCGVLGANTAQPRAFQYYPGDLATTGGAGNNKYLFTIKNSTTFPIGGAITNKVDTRLHYIGFSNKGSTWVTLRLLKNATLSGTSYSNIDSTNSCMQYSTAGSYTSGGTEVFVMPLAQLGQELLFLTPNDVEIVLYPGDTITFLADVGGNTTVNISVYWRELY